MRILNSLIKIAFKHIAEKCVQRVFVKQRILAKYMKFKCNIYMRRKFMQIEVGSISFSMYFILVLLCDSPFKLVHGILGGQDISISEAPYQINYGDICGGVLIHPQWAMTTAHCGTEATFIRLGSKYRQKSSKVLINSRIIHPMFSRRHEFDFDVQLLNFRTLHLSKTVSPIEISDGECGSHISVTGWGFPKEKGDFNNVLRRVRLEIVPREKCRMVQQPWYQGLTDRMFCADGGEEDACQGDSGGPAVSFGRLVGISSFGYGCGRVPGVYVNISHKHVRSWIKRHTGV